MKIEYRTVDTSTLKGLKQAERLHQNGWKMGAQGLFSIQFYKEKLRNRSTKLKKGRLNK
jgi:hypothetical protein